MGYIEFSPTRMYHIVLCSIDGVGATGARREMITGLPYGRLFRKRYLILKLVRVHDVVYRPASCWPAVNLGSRLGWLPLRQTMQIV